MKSIEVGHVFEYIGKNVLEIDTAKNVTMVQLKGNLTITDRAHTTY